MLVGRRIAGLRRRWVVFVALVVVALGYLAGYARARVPTQRSPARAVGLPRLCWEAMAQAVGLPTRLCREAMAQRRLALPRSPAWHRASLPSTSTRPGSNARLLVFPRALPRLSGAAASRQTNRRVTGAAAACRSRLEVQAKLAADRLRERRPLPTPSDPSADESLNGHNRDRMCRVRWQLV